MSEESAEEPELKILVFSTETISDPGIDFAGSAHLSYPPSALVLPVPCSSGIRPEWILYALDHGFDGVFIAADGTDCAYVPDCTARTGDLVGRAQAMLSERDMDPRRLKMAAICSVCADAFAKHIRNFEKELAAMQKDGVTAGRGAEA
jgi:coenzyme F420-reducing hydrogenase delta subunit